MLRPTVSLLALSLCALAAPQLPPDFEKQVDAVCAVWKADGPGGVVGVGVDGKLVFAKGYGLANIEGKNANTADTVMDVGSVSKQVTAMCILLLEDQGKLKTSDDVNLYLPEVPTFGRKVTIDNLLHMTSGLRDYLTLMAIQGWNLVDARTYDDMLNIMARQTGANTEPGVEFNYCNAGYAMMSVIVERVSKQTLPTFARENVFKPLGMANTRFLSDPMELVPNRATSYLPQPPGTPAQAFSSLAIQGDGGLHTTLGDFLKWHENFYDNKLGKKDKALTDKMVAVFPLNDGKPNNYACGLVVDKFHEVDRVWHNGNWLGYSASTMRFPARHISVLCFSNDGQNSGQSVAVKVAELALGWKAPAPAAAVEVPIEKLKQLEGVFALPDARKADFKVQEGKLTIQVTGQVRRELVPESDSAFAVKGVEARVVFVRGADGAVKSATVHQGGRDVPLVKPRDFTATEADAKAWVGTYRSYDLDMTVVITASGAALTLDDGKGKQLMSLTGPDEASAQALTLRAVRDAAGVVRVVTVDAGRARGMRAVRQS